LQLWDETLCGEKLFIDPLSCVNLKYPCFFLDVISISPSHISVYDLQIEEGTAFGRWYTPGLFPLPEEGTAADMYKLTSKRLSSAGYEHYEVSNFALAGKRGRHNQRYWNCRNVIGFGIEIKINWFCNNS
jgi:coproporphyrinogen III oxidase-like Fe-S oxidoreductase